MALEADGIQVTGMINFGQPRTGDIDYAHFSDKIFPQYRVVHY